MSRRLVPSWRRARNTAMLVLPLLLPVQGCSSMDGPVSPEHWFSTGLHASPGSAGGTMPVPFKGRLEGVHVSRTPVQPPLFADVFELTGQATQLGQFELVIEAVVNFGSFPVTGTGTLTFTAANGDRVVANATGSSRLLAPGLVLITEHATIDPRASTGRFAGAIGTFTVQRQADAATGVTGITRGTFEGTMLLRGRGQGHDLSLQQP
jgi:hypothetical protein